MEILLLLFAAVSIMRCKAIDVGSEIEEFPAGLMETETRLDVSLPNHGSSQKTENIWKEMRLSEEQNKIDLRFTSVIVLTGFHHIRIGSNVMLEDFILALFRREVDKIAKDIGSGTRTKRQLKKDFADMKVTWRGGVFYAFNTSDEIVQKAFKMGVKVWSDNTCIDFTEDRAAKDKVVVVSEHGCWSSIGRQGGTQLLSLDEDCVTEGSAVHEIGHVLGFYHTMSRYDRDSYITILMQNVDPLYKNEFGKVGKSFAEVYGLTYDYGSIMHYGEQSCSANDQPTMIAKDPYYQKTMGSEIISFSDLYMINEHYGCNAKCNKSTSANCKNEGFPHPRNCSICICPGGYGGALCDCRPPGCGGDLAATSVQRTLVYRHGFGNELRDQFSFCSFVITAPKGKKIEVDLQSISPGYDNAGCTKGGVEIKAQEDQKLTGYRFCAVNGSGGPIVSVLNRLPLILFNRLGVMEVVYSYRYID